jgi:hypothetical protein
MFHDWYLNLLSVKWGGLSSFVDLEMKFSADIRAIKYCYISTRLYGVISHCEKHKYHKAILSREATVPSVREETISDHL